jgi:hypothetical protein
MTHQGTKLAYRINLLATGPGSPSRTKAMTCTYTAVAILYLSLQFSASSFSQHVWHFLMAGFVRFSLYLQPTCLLLQAHLTYSYCTTVYKWEI